MKNVHITRREKNVTVEYAAGDKTVTKLTSLVRASRFAAFERIRLAKDGYAVEMN